MPIFGAKSRAMRGCASKLACGRRIDPAECDGVLLGNGAEQEEGIKPGYRYDYPVELLLLIRNERDFDRVYNTLLVEAYQYRQQLPPPERAAYHGMLTCLRELAPSARIPRLTMETLGTLFFLSLIHISEPTRH